MCLAAATALAAASSMSRHSWELSSERAEARGESFILKFSLLFEKSLCGCNQPAQGCVQLWHGIWFARTVVLLSCARAKLIQLTASWRDFHLLWWCTFLGSERSTLGSSSSGLSPKGFERCEEDGLSSLFTFSSSSDKSRPQDWSDIESQPQWNRDSFHLE